MGKRAPQLLAALTESVQDGDDAQARTAVHGRRGTPANIGAPRWRPWPRTSRRWLTAETAVPQRRAQPVPFCTG